MQINYNRKETAFSSCLSVGHRRRPLWRHSGLRWWTEPVQHVGPSAASRRHHGTGQLLSVHAGQCGSMGRRQRGSVRRRQQSRPGDLRRSCFWFLKDLMHRHSRRRLATSVAAQEEERGAAFLHIYTIAIFQCGHSISSLATSQEAKIARVLATNCCHFVFSLQHTSFHLKPSLWKSSFWLYSYTNDAAAFVVNVSSSRLFWCALEHCSQHTPVGPSAARGQENRKLHEIRV